MNHVSSTTPRVLSSCVLLSVPVISALAWQTPVGPAPVPAFADMERTTNATIQAETLQCCRVFECSVSLLATPSNAVEVAFGTSRNGDGVLHHGDVEPFFRRIDGGDQQARQQKQTDQNSHSISPITDSIFPTSGIAAPSAQSSPRNSTAEAAAL